MTHSRPLVTYGLLLCVISIWGIAWPISKIGLMDMSPIWYTALRLVIGFITISAILLSQGKIPFPKKQDIPFLCSIGLGQMAAYLLFINGALSLLDAGRSAILVYSSPFVVAPIAVLFFGEKLSPLKLVGLVLGLIGVFILFTPQQFNWHSSKILLGNSFLILAAITWAATMLHTRYGKWHTPSLYLVPWQLLLASLIVIVVAFIMEPHPHIHWTMRLIWTGLYNGMLSTGFAYAAIIYISQRLPVTTTSLLLLGVPVLGLAASAWWLQEPLTSDTLLAIFMIVGGLVIITLDNKKELST